MEGATLLWGHQKRDSDYGRLLSLTKLEALCLWALQPASTQDIRWTFLYTVGSVWHTLTICSQSPRTILETVEQNRCVVKCVFIIMLGELARSPCALFGSEGGGCAMFLTSTSCDGATISAICWRTELAGMHALPLLLFTPHPLLLLSRLWGSYQLVLFDCSPRLLPRTVINSVCFLGSKPLFWPGQSLKVLSDPWHSGYYGKSQIFGLK